MTLDKLIGKGLQREPADAAEIARFLGKVSTKLQDARNTAISPDSRFDIAYEALLQLGLAALRAHDLRPDSRGGHHVLALQTLEKTIGYPRENIRLVDTFRRQRAAGLYDGSFEPSEAEVAALLDAAIAVRNTLERWLANHRPQLLAGSPRARP